jgi:3-hydroxyisobutyrate dehydrogenase-like beta-hydroxyacid dehydrogenase
VPFRLGIIGTGAMGLGVFQNLARNGIEVGARDILPLAEAGPARLYFLGSRSTYCQTCERIGCGL